MINLDPTTGSAIKKIYPCVVISPTEIHGLNAIIIAPMTSTYQLYPTRIPVLFGKKEGYIVLDQIRTVDKLRWIKMFGIIEKETAHNVLNTLQGMLT